MLDSSPVSLPPIPRPLKRSASVASLPTPPRTHHKRKRAGSKHSRDADSDEGFTATDEEDDEKLIKEAEDEESFWLAANSVSTTSRNASPPLLYRRLQSQRQSQVHGVPPVSPPPSHRKPPVKAAPVPRTPTPKSTSTVSPPSTPPPKRRNGVLLIPRDSPDNPFLASPLGSQDEVVVNESDSVPSSQEEKPEMAFVFRGVRRSFPNPYYNPSSSSGPNPNSQLPPEHPDFEPEERGVRKLLFGVGRRSTVPKKSGNKSRREVPSRGRQGRRTAASAKSANRTPGESDGEAEEKGLKPMKLNFAA